MKEYFEQPQKQEENIEKATASVFKDGNNDFFNTSSDNYHSLKESNDPDLSHEIFKEINPMGLMLSDVKKKLENEIQEQEDAIQELKQLEQKDNEYRNFIGDMEKEIIKKKWWISKIDDFLTDTNIEDLKKLIPNNN